MCIRDRLNLVARVNLLNNENPTQAIVFILPYFRELNSRNNPVCREVPFLFLRSCIFIPKAHPCLLYTSFPAYSNAKIIALEDISIYTEDEDMPLKTVFKRMYEKEEGKPAINHKESADVITDYIKSVIPEYDADRV